MAELKVKYIPIGDVKPYGKNPRKNAGAVKYVANSLREFGWRQPIVIDSGGVIVAGHTRLLAAQSLGMDTVPVVVADDLTPEQIKAYRLADNKTAEFAEWDADLLDMELDDLDIDMTLFGFELDEPETEPQEITEDEIPEAAEKRCKLGDLWKLGEHRLICGDSTDPAIIDRLMGGQKADISITSPPYGEAGSAGIREHYIPGKKRLESLYKQHDDKKAGWHELITKAFENMQAASEAQFINIQMLAGNKISLIEFLEENKETFVDAIIWDKMKAPPQMQERILNNQWEFIFVFSNEDNSRTIPFSAFRGNVNNIFQIKTGANEFSGKHRAVFPVELPSKIMMLASKAETVLDVFGGTGTTMIACEQMGKRCFMSELTPEYCDIILERWETLTGGKAELITQE